MANDEQAGPVRESWEFVYRTTEVWAAAQERVAHHTARGSWWKSQLDQAEAALKEKGFEYRKSERSFDDSLVIIGDPQLATRAKECQSSITRHREKQQDYTAWVRALEGKARREPDSELTLRIEDVVFFGL
jgi:hypothetical protein